MPSAWNLLYIIPLLYVTYKAYKKSVGNYKTITSMLWLSFVLTWAISLALKNNVLGLVESNNYLFAAAIDLFVIAVLLRFVGFKLIVAALLLGYAAMFYFSYIPFSMGEISLRHYYIVLEAIGLVQIFFITWGIHYEQIITGIDTILRKATGGRLNVPSYFIRDELNIMDRILGNRNHSDSDSVGEQRKDTEFLSNKEEIKTPTYGTGAPDYWRSVK